MKNHHHNGHVIPNSNSRSVIHEAIATRAYELWLSYGEPENRAEEIWLEAERELVAGRRELKSEPALPVSF